jgi:hypothetical protein
MVKLNVERPYTNAFAILPALVIWRHNKLKVITLGWGLWSVALYIGKHVNNEVKL